MGVDVVLFQRLAIEMELSPEGRLRPRPGAAWRPEPARGEVAIHRELAALATAPDARIVAFASVHGYLRREGGGKVADGSPNSAGHTVQLGQQATDDSIRVQDWIERGAIGDPPEGTADTVAMVAVYASLPDAFLDAFDAFLDGTLTPIPVSPAAFFQMSVSVMTATGPASLPFLEDPGRVRAIDRDRLLRALRLSQWTGRVFGGVEPVPNVLAGMGGVDGFIQTMVANLPEAFTLPELLDGPDGPATTYMRSLASETLEDWRDTARTLRTQLRTLDLAAAALGRDGVSPIAKRELATTYASLASYQTPLNLAAAELAERLRPLMARRLESELASVNAWPIRGGSTAGLYVRALVALWSEVTQTAPPRACATAGCQGSVPHTRNRKFCRDCQAARRRDSVRRSRGAGPRVAG